MSNSSGRKRRNTKSEPILTVAKVMYLYRNRTQLKREEGVNLTPAVVAVLVEIALRDEAVQSGGDGEITMKKVKEIAEEYSINKKFLAALEKLVK